MSSPGYLTDAELVKVDAAGNRLSRTYAPSWFAATAELEKAFGFAPIITVTNGDPVGAYRTADEQRRVSPGTSPNYSDHCKGRAVDITNQRTFRNRDQTRFLNILSDHGWRNVNTSGHAFPSEPWHFANQSATPSGAGTLITETEYDMRAIREPGGGITLVGETTYQSLTLDQWNTESKVWGGYTQLTLAEYQKAIADTQVRRAYLLAGISGSGAASVDADAIAAKVAANIEADLAAMSDKIAQINASLGTPAEIAKAVNDDAAQRLAE